VVAFLGKALVLLILGRALAEAEEWPHALGSISPLQSQMPMPKGEVTGSSFLVDEAFQTDPKRAAYHGVPDEAGGSIGADAERHALRPGREADQMFGDGWVGCMARPTITGRRDGCKESKEVILLLGARLTNTVDGRLITASSRMHSLRADVRGFDNNGPPCQTFVKDFSHGTDKERKPRPFLFISVEDGLSRWMKLAALRLIIEDPVYNHHV
jgi:hypothetical protein